MTQGPKVLRTYTGTRRRGTRRLESITPGWMPMKKYKIAVLDDYQNVALESADWSVLRDRADIAVFQNRLAEPLNSTPTPVTSFSLAGFVVSAFAFLLVERFSGSSPDAPRSLARCAAMAIRVVPGLLLAVFSLRSRRCSYRRRLLPYVGINVLEPHSRWPVFR
jgi:hypothetical protein